MTARTRSVKCVPDPYSTRGYGSGTSKPVGTSIPADPWHVHIVWACGIQSIPQNCGRWNATSL